MFFFFGQIQGKKYVEKLARNGERQHPGHSKAYKSNAPQPHLMKPINHLKQTIHQIPIYVGPPQKGLRLRKAIDPSQNFPVQAIGPHYAAYGRSI